MAKQKTAFGHELSAEYICFVYVLQHYHKRKVLLLPPLSTFTLFQILFPDRYLGCGHCGGSNKTCHVIGHTDITDNIMQEKEGRSRLRSWHFNGTTCTFTPSHSLKLPLQGCSNLWVDSSRKSQENISKTHKLKSL